MGCVSCRWNVTVDIRQIISLNFTNFNLDSIPIGDWCNEGYAHVKVVDGNHGNSYVFCGKELPPGFISSTNILLIYFVSMYGYGDEFRAHYLALQTHDRGLIGPNLLTFPPKTSPTSEITEPPILCGGHFNQHSGVIYLPEQTSVNCRWNITVEARMDYSS